MVARYKSHTKDTKIQQSIWLTINRNVLSIVFKYLIGDAI